MTATDAQANKPQIKHYYRSALIDAKRWDNFKPRNDDIIITTSYKAGTTWMQGICAALVFQSPRPPVPQDELTPWLDANFGPIEEVLPMVEGLKNRRYIKTHLPLDGIRFLDEAKYIFVGRDGKDVWMSMWNHWHNMNPDVIDGMNSAPGCEGPKLLHPAEDINAAFDEWLTRGSFPWESDGYPFWSHLHHARSWWEFRHLPNILFVHFEDLLKDIDTEMRRISAYLDIPVDEEKWPQLLEGVSFKSMKADAETMGPGATQGVWKDSSNFFHKGTNKRWQGVLTDEQVHAYDELAQRELGPELAKWLEFGGHID
ncbi:MAG: sulfotransferase domain-containing protein [Gammaproteobacteria bacterium]